MRTHNTIKLLGFIAFAVLFTSCSTTRKLTEGEVLYTGVKGIKIEVPPKMKSERNYKNAVTTPLSVAPNNPLFTPHVRTPFPLGLWVYNWEIKKEKGFKWWLYKNFSKKPVLISDVQPDLRLEMVKNNLKDLGFFKTETNFEILHRRRNSKKAKIRYWVKLQPPIHYATVTLWEWPSEIDRIIRPAMANSLLKPGDQYDINIMEEERERIANVLRNRGYYYFQPAYIEYLADTTRVSGKIDLRITLKPNTPDLALHTYTLRDVVVTMAGVDSGGRRDSLVYDGIRLDFHAPANLKPKVFSEVIKVRPGQLYTQRRQTRTQEEFVRLGVFRYANLSIVPVDTIATRQLDFKIEAEYALPLETEIEVNVTSKSNDLLGPGVTLGINHKNIFRGAEALAVRLKGAYEWQLGGERHMDHSSLINSYEFGLDFSLSIPRLLLPNFLLRDKDLQRKTQFQIGADLLNRNKYFRMISFWGSASYDFTTSRRHYHSVVPFRLNYTHLLNTSNAFEETMHNNPVINLSFQDQLIPSMSYTYTFDRPATYRNPNRIFFKTSVAQAGNVISGINRLLGHTGKDKRFLNNVYSQFLKLTVEFIRYRQLDDRQLLAMRFMGGVGYAYGNREVMPYSEQFYAGGTNSIRAFRIRSLGPGSYQPDKSNTTAYLDQTGDVKLEGNIEYRFKMAGKLYGALFADAGNIWLLRKDSDRPGGEFAFRIKDLWKQTALGTGFGLRYDIKYLVIRADLGVALHAPYDTRTRVLNADGIEIPQGRYRYFNVRKYGFKDGLVLNLAIGYPF